MVFAELQTIWQKLDKRRPIFMASSVDIKTCHDEIVQDRIYDFLIGLDSVFETVHVTFCESNPSLVWRNPLHMFVVRYNVRILCLVPTVLMLLSFFYLWLWSRRH